jgi:hypothetical protein
MCMVKVQGLPVSGLQCDGRDGNQAAAVLLSPPVWP